MQSESLDTASDDQIWDYAQRNGFAIVTKDEDFDNLATLRGSPPKIIWLQLGNCTTDDVESRFRDRFTDVDAFDKDPAAHTFAID